MDGKLPAFVLVCLFTFSICDYNEEPTSSAPYVLKNGDIYRDILTLQTAHKAAILAKMLKRDDSQKVVTERPQLNKRISPEFFEHENFTFGERKSDEDIFDFIDSRFLNPPQVNRYNHPIAKVKQYSPAYNHQDFSASVDPTEKTFSIVEAFHKTPTNSDVYSSYEKFELQTPTEEQSQAGVI